METTQDLQLEMKKLHKRMKEIKQQRIHELGKNVKNRRKELNMTQEELHVFTGVGRTQLTNLEGGKSSFTMINFLAICDALETTPNNLLGY